MMLFYILPSLGTTAAGLLHRHPVNARNPLPHLSTFQGKLTVEPFASRSASQHTHSNTSPPSLSTGTSSRPTSRESRRRTETRDAGKLGPPTCMRPDAHAHEEKQQPFFFLSPPPFFIFCLFFPPPSLARLTDF
ncbi:hypothetical protein V8C26DRAFT_386037 [Trichoderma gracile]